LYALNGYFNTAAAHFAGGQVAGIGDAITIIDQP